MNQEWERLTAKVQGQPRWTERLAREVIATWRQSGLSGIAAAQQLGVDPQRLYWWRDRLGLSWASGQRQDPEAQSKRFLPVVVRNEPVREPTEALVVQVGDDVRVQVRGADASTAAWVALLASALREVRT